MVYGDQPTDNTLCERLGAADGVILWRERTRVTEDFLAAATHLRVIGLTGYTWDHVDRVAAGNRGVALTVSPLMLPRTHMVKFTLRLLLNLARRIAYVDRHMRTQQRPAVLTTGLYGEALGIVGHGVIGRGWQRTRSRWVCAALSRVAQIPRSRSRRRSGRMVH